MESPHRSAKAEREELQTRWRRLGWTFDRIAAEYQRRYQVGPLTAYRWAHRMTLQAVAEEWNQLAVQSEHVMVLQTVSDWERGVREAPVSALNRLARIFRTTTAALIEGVDYRHLDPARTEPPAAAAGLYVPTASPDEQDRYRLAVTEPSRVDEGVVAYLVRVLAEHRRADDLFGPKGVMPAITGQLEVIQSFAKGARPAMRQAVLYVACEYAQLLGWMHQDAARHQLAERWFGHAEAWALESGNLPMVATALSMKADLAWTAREPWHAVSLARSAQADRWRLPPSLRALGAQEEAGAWALGWTLTGDRLALGESRRKLDEVARHVAAMGTQPEAPWTYFFTPDYSRMQRASVLRVLGRAEEAIPLLEAGIGKLTQLQRRERGQYLARLGSAYFQAGDRGTALQHAEEAAAIARDTGSGRTGEELRRLRASAEETGAATEVRRLDELLSSMNGGVSLKGPSGGGEAGGQ